MPLISWLNSAPRLALRWLLQVDQPVPALSEHEIAAEVERHYPWNFTVNLIDIAVYSFGASFMSAGTILPLFISKLTSDPLPIGLLAIIAQSAWFAPQLLTANAIERLPRKKPAIVNLGFFTERLPTWLMVIAVFPAVHSPTLTLVVFLAGYTWYGLGAGVVATAWQELVARCFPVNRRGRFYGTSTFLGSGAAVAGAALSTWLLQTFPFPTNFLYIFAIAAGGITASWAFLALTREPAQPAGAAHWQSNRQFWAGLPDILRQDHNFRRFLLTRMVMALSAMGAGFVTVAAVKRWEVPDSTVGIFTIALLLGQTAGNLTLGLLADRFGHKLALEIGALAASLSFASAWLAPSADWYYAVFALLGVAISSIMVSGILVTLEFCGPQRRPTYIGITNTAVGLVSTGAPLLGVWLARIDYGWLFAASAAISLAGLILLRWWVREPRHAAAF